MTEGAVWLRCKVLRPRVWCMTCMDCEGALEGNVYDNTAGTICRRRFWKSLRSPPQGTHVFKDNRKTVSTIKVLVIRLVDDVLLPGYLSKNNVDTEHCQYFAVLFVRSPVSNIHIVSADRIGCSWSRASIHADVFLIPHPDEPSRDGLRHMSS